MEEGVLMLLRRRGRLRWRSRAMTGMRPMTLAWECRQMLMKLFTDIIG